MAISINWPTGVIYVPKADLTLIQASPEIRALDLNAFRLELKDLEDSDAGIPFTKTHIHNTEVNLSGIVYARIVSVIAPYTVEFEDGQYAVSCVGANHNLADVKVANQVSLLINNAAGLISNAAIEYSSFNEIVLVDQINGVTGTLFPKGTIQAPVLLLSDAKIISEFRGIDTIKFIGNGLITTGDSFVGYLFQGFSPTLCTITVDSAAVVTNSEFNNCTITGTLDGGSTIRDCQINTLNYINGNIYNSIINSGTITLGGGTVANFLNCFSGVPGPTTPIIDLGGSGQSLSMRNYNGGIKFINKTGTDAISIDLNSGQVILDTSTVTNGTIVVRGVGKLVDELGVHILTGAWNGVTIVNETVNSTTIGGGSLTLPDIADAVWDEQKAGHVGANSYGKITQDLETLAKQIKALTAAGL